MVRHGYRGRHERTGSILGIYWTLGRYDSVVIFEAFNEKVAMNMALKEWTEWI